MRSSDDATVTFEQGVLRLVYGKYVFVETVETHAYGAYVKTILAYDPTDEGVAELEGLANAMNAALRSLKQEMVARRGKRLRIAALEARNV